MIDIYVEDMMCRNKVKTIAGTSNIVSKLLDIFLDLDLYQDEEMIVNLEGKMYAFNESGLVEL